MLPAGGVYAVKKRKKPVPKSPKPPTPEGTKSNPSKRHRDRLNQELNKLTNLLPFPEDVRARLDKLSILRLAVGYLKVKGYFTAILKNLNTGGPGEQSANSRENVTMPPHVTQEAFSEGDLLLQALHGFFIAVTADGYIFYVSPTVQDYLGFHQSDIIYQSVFELIHTDDRAMFRCQLHWSLNPPSFRETEQDSSSLPENETPLNNGSTMYDLRHPLPENSSFLDRSFVCRFRCLLDNSSGFMALDFHGRLKFLYGQNKKAEDGSLMPPQLALFAIAVPLQPLSILELRTKIYIFQTKHKLDFTPMACDARGKVLLGYTETELCMRGSGYQFIHAADMMYCAEKHVRMMKMGESGMTIFRLLTKKAGWLWVQSNARLVYKGGQPDCIIARQRVLSNEEGEEHLHKRATSQLPFNFATGEAVLYENNLSGFLGSLPPKKGLRAKKEAFLDSGSVDPNSLLGAMMQQDESAYISRTAPAPSFSFPDVMQAPRGWEANDKNGKIIKDETDSLLTVIESLFERHEPESNIFKARQNLDGDTLESQKWEESMFPVSHMESPSFQGRLQPGVSSCRNEVGFPPESGKYGDFPPLNITTSLQSLRHQAPLRGPSHQTPPMHPFQHLFMNSPNEKDAGHSWEHYWHSVGPDPVVHLSPGLQEYLPDLPQQMDGQSHRGSLTFGTCSNSMSTPEIQATSGHQNSVFSRQTSWLPWETDLANSTAAWPSKCTLASEKVVQPSTGCDVSAQSGQFRPRALGSQWLDPEPAGISVPQVPPQGTKPRSRVDSLPLGEPMDVEPQFQTQRAQTNPLGSRGARLWVSSRLADFPPGGPRGPGISDPQQAQRMMSPCFGQQTGPPEGHQLPGACSSYWPNQQRQPAPVTDIYREQEGFPIQPEQYLVKRTDHAVVPMDRATRGHCGAPLMREAGPGVHHQTASGRGASCQRQGMLQSTSSCSASPPWLSECSLSSPEYHSGLPSGEGDLSPLVPPGAPFLGGSSKPAEAPSSCPDRLSSSALGREARLERSWSLPAHPSHPPFSRALALGRPDDDQVSSHNVPCKPSHQKEESSSTGFPATVYSPQTQFTSSSEVRSQHPPWD